MTDDNREPWNGPNFFGTGSVFWTGDITRFFPSSEPLSGAMVGLLVRADEVRICMAHLMKNLHDVEHGLEERNPTLRNREIENFMFYRMAVTSTFDIEKHLVELNKDSRFRDALNALPRKTGDGFFEGKREISGTIKKWKPLRDKLFAHIDYEPVAASLERGDATGGAWLGKRMGDFSFPVAHLAVMISMEPAHGDEFMTNLRKTLDIVARTHAATIKVVWPAIYAFDSITTSFLPEKLRPKKKSTRIRT